MNAPPWLPLVETLKQALAAKDRDAANAAVRGLLDRRAALGEQWQAIAQLMRVSGELTLAHRAIDAYVAAAGNVPQARYAKVVLLTQSNRLREAHALLETLPADVPDRAGHAYVLGNIEMTMGRVEAARAHLTRALDYRPGWGPAWLTLAATGNLADDPLGDRMLGDAVAAERQGAGDLARYHYAVGKLQADRRDPAATFAAYKRGADLLRRETPYSRAGNERNAAAAMTGFDDGLLERLREGRDQATGRPIFVTGLPRSGTTLVEHILASHSEVSDGGELNIVQHVAVAAGGNSGSDLTRYLDGGGSLDRLSDLYLHLLRERYDTPGRVVDKTIDVSRCLGLIAAALPDAPLIWMRRDPLDSAWSCFRTFFIHGVGWSYSLTDIAHHFRLEDRLRAYWQQRLGERLLVVPYAALIDAPEDWTRRILAHCGLSDEAATHRPQDSDRIVATASALQVRRPINRDGLGVAEPYREWLQPFIDAYGAA